MKWFRGVIAHRLVVNFSVLALFVVLTAGAAIYAVHYVNTNFSDALARTNLGALGLQIRVESTSIVNLAQRYIEESADAAAQNTIRQEIAARRSRLNQLIEKAVDLTSANDLTERTQLAHIQQQVVDLNHQVNRLLQASDSEKSHGPATMRELQVLVNAYEAPLAQSINEFQMYETGRVQATQTAVSQVIQLTFSLVIVVSLLAVGLAIVMVSRSVSTIIIPLGKLHEGVEQLRSGRLDQPVQVSGRDEMGALASAFNTMAQQLVQRMQAELAARQELEKLNAELEDRVRQRTSELAQRADQLALINRISRDAISLLDLNALLARAVSTIRETFGYYEVGILLVDQAANTICLRAASTLESGDFLEGQEPLSLNPPDSLIGHAALTGQPLVAGDARQDPRFRYDERLPRTQSELALPLRVGDQIVGVLDLESTALNAFSAQDVQVLQTLADQIAVAIQNARLYEGEAEARRAADILSEEAQLARAEAEKANRAKSEFLASMSHELRTPLNGILGYAQILKRDKGLSPAQMDGLNIIQHSGEHLLTLINDILDLAKIEAGRLELGPTDFNLPNFLQGITGIIRMRAEQKNIVFAYEADTPLPAGVRADERRLRQVLINLLGNAVKFTDAGQVTFKISDLGFNPDRPSYAESDLCTLRFTVKDTGVGIAPELLEKIFSPFEQAGDLRRRAEGTGLGLSISRKLVQAMGSDIRVSSQLGQGSAFEFELQLPVAIHIGNERAIEQTIVGYKGPARTALVVDDKNYNRAVLVNLLAGLGFEIVEAENGRQAVDKARERRPDIILMDLVMPVMTGFEATQQIRKLPGMERVVIIATTASAFDLDKQQSMLAGCDDFIAKPVSVKKLFALLEEHLELEWVYEEPEPPPPEVIVTASDAPPPLPPAEVASLYDLAMKGDVLGLQERAGQIETMGEAFQPFAARLRQLAKNFETEEILALVEQYTEAQP